MMYHNFDSVTMYDVFANDVSFDWFSRGQNFPIVCSHCEVKSQIFENFLLVSGGP